MHKNEKTDRYQLPDRFIYVCSASKSAAVNLTPIYHLGRKRIAAMVILRGTSNPDEPTKTDKNDKNEAITPANRLAQIAKETLGLSALDKLIVIDGNADEFSSWAAAAERINGLSSDLGNLPILVNLTSGTKTANFAIEHYLDHAHADWTRLLVGKRPATVSLIVPSGNELRQFWFEKDEEIAEQPPFDILLQGMGVESTINAASIARAKYYNECSEKAEKLYHTLSRHGGYDALRCVNIANSKVKNKDLPLDLSNYGDAMAESGRFKGYPGRALAHCQEIYTNAIGASEWNNGNWAGDRRAFLTGGWFEQYLFDQVRGWIGHKPHMTARTNVVLRVADDTADALEIDVLLQQDAQFHLIEAKTSTSSTGLFDYAKKLAALNRAVAGRPANSWIVAPFMHFRNDHTRDHAVTRCAALFNVKLLTGRDSIKNLKAEIDELDGP